MYYVWSFADPHYVSVVVLDDGIWARREVFCVLRGDRCGRAVEQHPHVARGGGPVQPAHGAHDDDLRCLPVRPAGLVHRGCLPWYVRLVGKTH